MRVKKNISKKNRKKIILPVFKGEDLIEKSKEFFEREGDEIEEFIVFSLESIQEQIKKVQDVLLNINDDEEKLTYLLSLKIFEESLVMEDYAEHLENHYRRNPYKKFDFYESLNRNDYFLFLKTYIELLRSNLDLLDRKGAKKILKNKTEIVEQIKGDIQLRFAYLKEIGLLQSSFFKLNEYSQEFKIITLSQILGCSQRYAQKLMNNDKDYRDSVSNHINKVKEKLKENKKPS